MFTSNFAVYFLWLSPSKKKNQNNNNNNKNKQNKKKKEEKQKQKYNKRNLLFRERKARNFVVVQIDRLSRVAYLHTFKTKGRPNFLQWVSKAVHELATVCSRRTLRFIFYGCLLAKKTKKQQQQQQKQTNQKKKKKKNKNTTSGTCCSESERQGTL